MSQAASYKKPFLILTLCVLFGSLASYAAEQSGTVESGGGPIRFSSVTLYRAGGTPSASPTILGSTQTDGHGSFSIAFTRPLDPEAVLYLIADGGALVSRHSAHNAAGASIRMATILGNSPIAAGVVVNERTTVAAAYALAQFIHGASIAGKSPGLQNAAAIFQNLVDPVTGKIGRVLGTTPNGLRTSTMREFNSLADLLATCVEAATPLPCRSLFTLTTTPDGAEPADTLQAVVNIAHNPWQRPLPLFLLSKLRNSYGPSLLLPPNAWTLALVYDGNGHEFDGPGNMSIDAQGNVWVSNNYTYSRSPFTCVSGGRQVLKLTPIGTDAPGAPYSGGGLYGAGFGIALDPGGNAWISNFGFQGAKNGVDCDPNPPATSVSKFSSNGTALSPDTGYTQGNISQPQGTASDPQGNVWFANCGNDSVTEYPGGNPALARNYHDVGLLRPFGLAIDGYGNAWISNNGNDTVVALTPSGNVLPGTPIAVGQKPFGVAVDSLGNVWVANSGGFEVPCGGSQGGYVPPNTPPSITEITPAGQQTTATSYTGGGLVAPWGVAVDGNDNIWVANFAGERLAEFCGAKPMNCPRGYRTGDSISPRGGYSSNALRRNTGVAIDSSGNVWLANNWRRFAVQTNPGGGGLVVFIGLAAPIRTPLIGLPHRP